MSLDIRNGNVVSTDTTITVNSLPWAYYASGTDVYQTITYTGTRYKLNVNQYIGNNIWGLSSSYIFE